MWFKLLHDEAVPDTATNLRDAANGENYEWTQMYANFAKEAKEEGFNHIAYLFEQVAKIEQFHQARFEKLLSNLETEMVFKKDNSVLWQCSNCGFIYEGKNAPAVCPVCGHPIAYFEMKPDANY